MTASTINCKLGQVKDFDTMFNHCDKETTGIIHNLFATPDFPELTITIGVVKSRKEGRIAGFSLLQLLQPWHLDYTRASKSLSNQQ